MSSASNGSTYRISFSKHIGKHITALGQRAMSAGVWDRYKAAWSIIDKKLRSDPLNFGDPTGNLASIKLRTFHRVVDVVYLVYCVDEARHIVYVKSVEPFPADAF